MPADERLGESSPQGAAGNSEIKSSDPTEENETVDPRWLGSIDDDDWEVGGAHKTSIGVKVVEFISRIPPLLPALGLFLCFVLRPMPSVPQNYMWKVIQRFHHPVVVPSAQVWAIQSEGTYYCSGSMMYGHQPGKYLAQADALTLGYQPALGSYCEPDKPQVRKKKQSGRGASLPRQSAPGATAPAITLSARQVRVATGRDAAYVQ
jgi:hypothetical protein